MPCLDNAIAVIPAHLWGRLPYAFALVLSIEILTYAYMTLKKVSVPIKNSALLSMD